jgi:hypothetical protein
VIQFIPQGPGPPQRPHIPGSAPPDDFPLDSAPTANTLNSRLVCDEPHLGQTTFVSPLIDFTSCSNRAEHFLQAYS